MKRTCLKKVICGILCLAAMLQLFVIPTFAEGGSEVYAESEESKILKGIGLELYFSEEDETVSYRDFIKTLLKGGEAVGAAADDKAIDEYAAGNDLVYNKELYASKPTLPITYKDACYTTLNFLGFKNMSGLYGSYPNNYLKLAMNFSLGDGVSAGENTKLSGADAVQMIYNSLFAPYSIAEINAESVDDYPCMMNKLYNIYREEGIVEANEYSGLYSKTSTVGENEIKIAGETYVAEGQNAFDLLGCYVNVFYEDTDEGKIVRYISLDKNKHDELVINPEDIDEKSTSTSLTYYENNKTRKASISSPAAVIYNGQAYSKIDFKAFSNIKNGSVRLIKNSLGKYSVIQIWDYDTIRIKYLKITSGDYKLFGYYDKEIDLKDYIDDGRLYITDYDGNSLMVSDLLAESVAWFVKSDDFVKLVVARESISGKITSMSSDNKVVIDGVEYEISKAYAAIPSHLKDTIKIGFEGTYYLDPAGKIYGVKKAKGTNVEVAYLTGVYEDTDNDELRIKVFDFDGNHVFYTLSERATVDGARVANHSELVSKFSDIYNEFNNSKDDIRRQLITFKLGSDGKVKSIETASKNPTDSTALSLLFNSSTDGDAFCRTSAQSFSGKVAFNSGAKIMLAPPKTTDAGVTISDEDYDVRKSYFSDNEHYKIEAYGFGESVVPDYYIAFPSGASIASSGVLAVDKISQVLNSDGEVVTEISGYGYLSGNKSVSGSFYTKSGISISGVSVGDLIGVGFDSKDRIVQVSSIVYDYSEKTFSGTINSWGAENRTAVLRPLKRFDNFFTYVTGTDPTAATAKEIIKPTAFRIFYFDSETEHWKIGSADDIKVYDTYGDDCSTIIYNSYWGDIRWMALYD